MPTTRDETAESTQLNRRNIAIELVVVAVITFGTSAAAAILSLIEAAMLGPLSDSSVALNPDRSTVDLINLLRQLLSVFRLLAWGALGWYLLRVSGISGAAIGLTRRISRRDIGFATALALGIGLPGLGLYLIGHFAGLNVTVVPSQPGSWWQIPMLAVTAVGNAVAEEVLVVAYFMTRLRQLGWSANRTLVASAGLRGTYHLYQGVGAGLGNVAMGLIFAKFWQVKNLLWPLILAHAAIDIVAYLGYLALAGHVGWLPTAR